MSIKTALAILLAACTTVATADDRADYNRRAAAADQESFRQLDVDRNGILTREEVRADLNFGLRFDDADFNRDGVVTADEMRRYLEQTYALPLEK